MTASPQTQAARRPIMPAREIAMVAVFAGVTAALGLLPPIVVPISPVPITAQSLGVVLAGAVLGGRRGAASQSLLLALVALGLPLLAGGRGGIGVFFGVTWGFLLGWVVVAGVVGWATYRLGAPYSLWKGIIINMVGGMVVLYAFGIVGMMITGKLSFSQALLGNLPFLPGDAIKCVIAALVAKGVHAAMPGLLPWRGARARPNAPQDQFVS